jgi:two-component system CheB/CheR fusion protein
VASTTSSGLVYVIEDDAAVRDSLKVLLEAHGLEVEDFETTAEFTVRYRQRRTMPDVRACVVLDHDLPTTTGLDFLVSPDSVAGELPVILLTGRGETDLAARARAAGALAFFEKPAGEAQLVREILRLLTSQDALSDR